MMQCPRTACAPAKIAELRAGPGCRGPIATFMAVASRSTFGVAPGDGHENLRSFAQPRFAAASRTTTAGLDRHSLRARRSKPPPGSVNSPICRSLCPAIYQGPIAGPRKALGERTRVVVEHGAEQGPARADALDLAGRVPSRARALSADRVGG